MLALNFLPICLKFWFDILFSSLHIIYIFLLNLCRKIHENCHFIPSKKIVKIIKYDKTSNNFNGPFGQKTKTIMKKLSEH